MLYRDCYTDLQYQKALLFLAFTACVADHWVSTSDGHRSSDQMSRPFRVVYLHRIPEASQAWLDTISQEHYCWDEWQSSHTQLSLLDLNAIKPPV